MVVIRVEEFAKVQVISDGTSHVPSLRTCQRPVQDYAYASNKTNQKSYYKNRRNSSVRSLQSMGASTSDYNHEPSRVTSLKRQLSFSAAISTAEHQDDTINSQSFSGISNLGNTCYMNSVLQCLSACSQLSHYFLSNEFLNNLRQVECVDCTNERKILQSKTRAQLENSEHYGTGGALTEVFADTIKSLWSNDIDERTVRHFHEVVCRFNNEYGTFKQQVIPFFFCYILCVLKDAQEFLMWLLDKIHEDLNTAIKRLYKDITVYGSEKDKAESSRSNHLQAHCSIIIRLFSAQFRSSIYCPRCHTEALIFDPYMCVSLQIPQEYVILCISLKKKTRTCAAQNPKLIICELDESGYCKLMSNEASIESLHSDKLSAVEMPEFYPSSSDPVSTEFVNVIFSIIEVHSRLDRKQEQRAITMNQNLTDIAVVQLRFEVTDQFITNFMVSEPERVLVDSSSDSLKETSQSTALTLTKCLDFDNFQEFTRPELIEWKCENCGWNKGEKKMKFRSLPRVLVFHLKRFRRVVFMGDGRMLKLDRAIHFPTEGLDMSPYVHSSSNDLHSIHSCLYLLSVKSLLFKKPFKTDRYNMQYSDGEMHLSNSSSCWDSGSLRDECYSSDDCLYDLFAVVHHIGGTINAGHYTASTRNAVDSKWRAYDDCFVRIVNPNDIAKCSDAYLLFYERRINRKHTPSIHTGSFINFHLLYHCFLLARFAY
ncbi:unnamed protein product [Anisakis simplex]|uniref:Ubiquitin carboxyl-terminal hydrolase n=1 Tax=Anisakis simplex TaxID=6269 RepID=A0A0M3JYB4_ANISI|nr:unnamed protein product [Anisakis simplex]